MFKNIRQKNKEDFVPLSDGEYITIGIKAFTDDVAKIPELEDRIKKLEDVVKILKEDYDCPW